MRKFFKVAIAFGISALRTYNYFATRLGHQEATLIGSEFFGNPKDLIPCDDLAVAVLKTSKDEEQFRKSLFNGIFCWPNQLDSIKNFYDLISKSLNSNTFGNEVFKKFESQIKTWLINFPDRIRLKRVVIIINFNPIVCFGAYLNDIIRLASCRNFDVEFDSVTSFKDLSDFNPDVIIVNSESDSGVILSFFDEESFPNVSAVKRGCVYIVKPEVVSFLDVSPDSLFLAGGIIVSALADLDSGYLTPKGSFYKLSYLQMFRHKL